MPLSFTKVCVYERPHYEHLVSSHPWLNQSLNQSRSMVFAYRKSSIKPPGVNLISDLPEKGLLERGDLFIKSTYKDIFDSFSVLFISFCPMLCGINIKYYGTNASIYSFYPKPY